MKGTKSHSPLADIVRTAKEEEREACAAICDLRASTIRRGIPDDQFTEAQKERYAEACFIASRIRSRGATDLHAIKNT